jgi:O-antigen/teichoic acid export membrane protein
MTLWERILQGVTAFSLEIVVSIVASVLGARLVFQYLSPADYGQLALYLSFYTTGGIFLNLGLGWLFVAEIARARGAGERGWARYLATRYSVLLLTMGTFLLFLFVGIGLWQGEPLLWSIVGVYLWLTAPNSAAQALFHGATRYRRLAAQSIARSLSRLALLATLPWWWPGQRLTGVALTYPLMELVAALVAGALARAPWMDLGRVSTLAYSYRDLLSLFTHQGVYETLSKPVKKVAEQLPIWFLKAMAGNAGLGAYAAAERAYTLVFSFFSSLETTLFPLVSEQAKTYPERLRVALRQAQKYSFWLGLLVALLGNAAASWIVLLIAGQQYGAVVPLFQLLLWRLLIYAFSQSQRPIFHAVGQQRGLLFTYLFTAIAESAFLLVAIQLLGASGAAWAVLLGNCVSVIVGYVFIRRMAPQLWIDPRGIIKVEEFDLILWRRLTRRGRR